MNTTFYCFFAALLMFGNKAWAQMEIREWRYQTDVRNEVQGTKGINLQFDYLYSGKTVLPTPIKLRLEYNGRVVYADSTAVLVLVPNKPQTAQLFVPYRQIDLENGDYDMVIMQFQCGNLTNWSETLVFTQPPKVAVELLLTAASVKQRMEQWDRSTNPRQWAPDPYFSLFTGNAATQAIFTCADTLNSYTMPVRKVQVFTLVGEPLVWRWYDKDETGTDTLGTYHFIAANGDFKKDFEGLMFGEMKGVSFSYSQKVQQTQPITLRVQPDFVHEGRKGVRIEAEYHLARAYRDEWASALVWLENADGDSAMLQQVYPLQGSPALGKAFKMDKNSGKIAYFVPFYQWRNDTKFIRFSFQTQNGLRTVSAPFAVLNAVEYPRAVVSSGYLIDHNYKYKGASGIRLRLHYQVRDIHQYAPLQLAFSAPDGGNFDIYLLQNAGHQQLKKQKLEIGKPREKDTLYFFIPYFNLTAKSLEAKMEMVPDSRVLVLHEKMPPWAIPKEINDVVLELKSAENLCWENNYGHVMTFYYHIPQFLLPYSRFHTDVWLDGNPTRLWVLSANSLDTAGYPLRDTGYVRLVMPFRRLLSNDSLRVVVQMREREGGRAMSQELKHTWKAPIELHNQNLTFDLRTLVWDKSTSVTEDSVDFPFDYVLKIGDEVKIKQPLHPTWSKTHRDEIARKYWVHREDKIEICIVDKRKNGKRYTLWQGDVGKLQQAGYMATYKDVFGLLRKAVLVAKTE